MTPVQGRRLLWGQTLGEGTSVRVVYLRRADEAVGELRREREERQFTKDLFMSREFPWSQKAQRHWHFRSHYPVHLKTEVLG